MLLLSVLWIGWCCLHSLLITTAVRHWFEARGGLWLGIYRLGYVLFSLVTLMPLLWYTHALPQHQVVTPSFWLLCLQGLLFVYALVLFVGGMRAYDLHTFLGFRQWQDYRAGRVSSPPAFSRSGILRFVRHPWYSGGIALLWSLPALTDVTLVSRTILTSYLIIGAWLEERKLKAALGEPYRAYCREVPMFFPWKLRR